MNEYRIDVMCIIINCSSLVFGNICFVVYFDLNVCNVLYFIIDFCSE